MKKICLLFCVLIFSSCSKEEIIENNQLESDSKERSLLMDSSKKPARLTPKDRFLSLNQDRSFILTCDSNGNIISYQYLDGLVVSGSIGDSPSCDPFISAGAGFMFVDLFNGNLWTDITNNSGFSDSYPNGISSKLNSIYANIDNHYSISAPGMAYVETDFFEVIYQESPEFDIDPTFGDYYNYPNLGASIPELDFITGSQANYLRDEIACHILSAYESDYEINSLFIKRAVTEIDALLCSVNPSQCDSRYIIVRVSVGLNQILQ